MFWKPENLKRICSWNAQPLSWSNCFSPWYCPLPGHLRVQNELTPCSISYLGVSLCPRAVMLQLEETQTHARARLILNERLLVKTSGKPSHVAAISPNPPSYTQSMTDSLSCSSGGLCMDMSQCGAGCRLTSYVAPRGSCYLHWENVQLC